MKAILASLCGIAALAACSTYDPNYTASPPNPDPLPLAQGTIVAPAGSVAVPSGRVATTPAVVVPAAPAAVAVAPAAVRFDPGNGTVTSVAWVSAVAPSASAGASVIGPPAKNVYRLGIRMDDGATQTLDQDSSAFHVGDRIEVTRDAHIVRR
jgi:hypothetical protein